MIASFFSYSFIQNAFVSAILASLISGIIGTIIVEKKLVSMSGGIAHASFGGIGLGYLLGIEPIIGGVAFAVSASLGIRSINKSSKIKNDTLVGIFWSVGMALGILFISITPGYMPDMTSYLFGDILTVPDIYIYFMTILCVITLVIVFLFYNYIKAYLFDELYANTMGINVNLIEIMIYILIPLCIIALVKVVGIILAIALLTIPTSIAKMFCSRLEKVIIVSVLLGIFFSFTGIFISYWLNIPSGASIIVFSSIVYFILTITVPYIKKRIHIKQH